MKEIKIYTNQIDWKIPLLICVACFYLAVIGNGVFKGNKFNQYRGDYIAFWSVGKIANEKGYSEIYNLNYLQSVQSQGVKSIGFRENIDGHANPTIPVPYFSFFILPFQLLAKVPVIAGYWSWTILNLVILISYLVFFMQKTKPQAVTTASTLYLLCTVLLSYSVFLNFMSAQVEVLLVVCVGEFIRSAMGKKPILSGIWLGGLMLKPQLLILIIPIFLFMRHWKAIFGFLVSSGIILLTSFSMSGFSGLQALLDLWTKYSVGTASNTPEAMINWRMVGINLNSFTGTSAGWIITSLGMVLTILAVYFLIKMKPPFGSLLWVKCILGVFSATIAVTWHSHYHMAMVLIPFLILITSHQLLPMKLLFSWAIVTPVILLGLIIFEVFVQVALGSAGTNFDGLEVAAYTGFVINLVVFISTLRSSYRQELDQ